MKTITRFALAAALLTAPFAFADEEAAPEGGGTGMRRSGYLLDASPQDRPMLLSVHAVLPYGYLGVGYGFPFGVGATFYIPIVKNGFIPPVNDEFGIDFGADATLHFGYSNIFSLSVPVSVLWTFHITDKFAAFAKLGVALRIWPGWLTPVYASPVSVVGINYMFSKSFGIRAEVGYPMVKFGVLFAF
ncbi:MAG: hypothetical protein ACOZQL_09130 [Myxococcota bacterium]